MGNFTAVKGILFGWLGAVGAAISSLYGGWNGALTTLLIFMGLDYLTGLIVAGGFKKNPKTSNGALESKAGWKGLCRKGMILLIALVATRLDMVVGTNFIKDAVIIAYIANESISIVENAGLMGVPIPAAIQKGIDMLSRLCGRGGSKLV